MPPYQYTPLSDVHNSIRLLRLLPAISDDTEIGVELFEYSLKKPRHSYETLSYVWGPTDPVRYVRIGNEHLDITPNLHAALVQLRDHSFPRIIWIDAICINQQDYDEKGVQIRSMARIYASAKCVIVYLGEATDNSDDALEVIRASAMEWKHNSRENTVKAVDLLLQREWFQRIWVLQEVAAARHIIIICGDTAIDGHAFSLAVDNFDIASGHAASYYRVRPILSLIRGAIFRPPFILDSGSKTIQDTRSMAELLTMYNNRKATVRHDKIFALLGMTSQDDARGLEEHGLLPDYSVPWNEVLQRLTRFILGNEIRVETWADEERVHIFGKGHALGIVSSITKNSTGTLLVSILNGHRSVNSADASDWVFQASASEVRKGDIVWLFQGAARPMMIRQKVLFFYVIMIEAPLPTPGMIQASPRNAAIIWDWIGVQEEDSSPRSMEAMNDWTVLQILYDLHQFSRGNYTIIQLIRMDNKMNKRGKRRPLCTLASIAEDQLPEILQFSSDQAVIHMLSWMKGKSEEDAEVVLEAIAQSRHKRLVAEVFDQEHGLIQVTEKILLAAVKQYSRDPHILTLLLDVPRETRCQITETILLACVSNRPHTQALLKMLLVGRADELDFPHGKVTSVLLKGVMQAHHSPRIIALLLNVRSETRYQITEDVLLAAARARWYAAPLLQMLLVDRANELDFPHGRLTSGLLEVVVLNYSDVLHAVALLLSLDADDIHMTEAVVTGAMKNVNNGHQLIPMLCQRSSKARDYYLSIIAASEQDDFDEYFTADLADAPEPNIEEEILNY